MYAKVAKLFYIITKPLSALFLHNSKRVRVVILYKNSILLQRSSFGHQDWSLPGGGIEKSETPKQAAVREVEEETGIKINEDELVILGNKYFISGKRYPKVNLVFFKVSLSHQLNPKINRPLEVLEARWFNLKNLPDNVSDTVLIARNIM